MFLPQYPQDVAIVKKNPVYGIIGNTFSFFEWGFYLQCISINAIEWNIFSYKRAKYTLINKKKKKKTSLQEYRNQEPTLANWFELPKPRKTLADRKSSRIGKNIYGSSIADNLCRRYWQFRNCKERAFRCNVCAWIYINA